MKIKVETTIENIRVNIINKGLLGQPKYGTRLGDKGLFAVYEEWTLANSNYMGISIVVYEEEDGVYIHFLATGAASGIFGFDWGAANRRNNRLITALQSNNIQYKIIENS